MDRVPLTPEGCQGLGPGRIERRQTTFWTVTTTGSHEHSALHFVNKHEFSFVQREYSSIDLLSEHPLPMDHRQPRGKLSFRGHTAASRFLESGLDARIREITANWRTLEHYRNPSIEFAELLESGSGVLLVGPLSLLDDLRATVAEHGLESRLHASHDARAPSAKLLLLDHSYVVADEFLIETKYRPGVV